MKMKSILVASMVVILHGAAAMAADTGTLVCEKDGRSRDDSYVKVEFTGELPEAGSERTSWIKVEARYTEILAGMSPFPPTPDQVKRAAGIVIASDATLGVSSNSPYVTALSIFVPDGHGIGMPQRLIGSESTRYLGVGNREGEEIKFIFYGDLIGQVGHETLVFSPKDCKVAK